MGDEKPDNEDERRNLPTRKGWKKVVLYKLLFRDLSTGSVIRQHRETDYAGNFITKQRAKPTRRGSSDRRVKSAFDDEEPYELTALGQQFVHYAMTELPTKIEYQPDVCDDKDLSDEG